MKINNNFIALLRDEPQDALLATLLNFHWNFFQILSEYLPLNFFKSLRKYP